MSEPLTIAQQRTLLADWRALLAQRAQQEPALVEKYRVRFAHIEKSCKEEREQIISQFENDKRSAEDEFEATQKQAKKRFDQERATQDRELAAARKVAEEKYERDSTAAKSEFANVKAALDVSFSLKKKALDKELEDAQEITTDAIRQGKRISREALDLLQLWKMDHDYGPAPEPSKKDRPIHDAFRLLKERLEEAEKRLEEFGKLSLPKLFQGHRVAWVFLGCVGAGVAIAGPIGWLEEHWIYGLVIGAVAGLLVGVLLSLWLFKRAKGQVTVSYDTLRLALADVDVAREKSREQAKDLHHRKLANEQKLHDQEVAALGDKYTRQRTAIKDRRNFELRTAQEKFHQELNDSTQRRDVALRESHEKYQRLRAEIYARYESDSHQLHERQFKETADCRQNQEEEWTALVRHWKDKLSSNAALARNINAAVYRDFPAWDDPSWRNRPLAAEPPEAIRLGEYAVDLATLPGGLSADPRMESPVPTQFTLPALVDFPERCSLLVDMDDRSRLQGIQVLQMAMFRFLTSFPPGKVRFTLIDPVGLGENFAPFMHLADHDEMLVTNKVWTEPNHIEQRLADLTEHLENVLQTYLRDEYPSIQEYNAQAGEVAEPFRVLVVADFPTNCTAEAARRLTSIVTSGVRCGVFTLLAVNSARELPHGFTLASVEPYLVRFSWQDGRFRWHDPDFAEYPLRMDPPPPGDLWRRLVQEVGQKAKEANRVEVPFDYIAPAREKWWTSDSRGGVEVPLGKAGATKRQLLHLGKGTSQHVLLAGKTGSGKSTLLHALITNAALHYGPDELELYLIDFKKGVEFKTYAEEELPHARVVAIESDREFGVSVLQRLDGELKARGELFRASGAQDLKSYREMTGKALPRICLVVDEFQEFFLEDDRVSQDATGLLDRLVRQGRAFGLHVLLGSQTLGGAFSLARSTIDQMGVRIALQCSEADGHLILSDDNSAARLLSRPGEAIYNDANGLVEGNHPFQVVWLTEERREALLRQVLELDRGRSPGKIRPQLVFEGNVPAEPRKNHLLEETLASPTWPTGRQAFPAWLGEPMAIKDPTAAVFRRLAGNNLLVIGQQEEAALGMLLMGLLSLASQHDPAHGQFVILDGSPPDSPFVGMLGKLKEIVPQSVQFGGWRELPALLGKVAEEVDKRQKNPESDPTTMYLVVFGLSRFRDLRKGEDDFSFGKSDEPPSPSKLFGNILRDGPGLGVHSLVWCDTATNAGRSLDRQAMREFDMRVLFQMSASDSSNLVDSPAASKLGANRALFHSEEEGRQEKFRPYAIPAESWLRSVAERLKGKR